MAPGNDIVVNASTVLLLLVGGLLTLAALTIGYLMIWVF